MSNKNTNDKKTSEQKTRENRPLTNKPFLAFFKHTKRGRSWVRNNFPKEERNE